MNKKKEEEEEGIKIYYDGKKIRQVKKKIKGNGTKN